MCILKLTIEATLYCKIFNDKASKTRYLLISIRSGASIFNKLNEHLYTGLSNKNVLVTASSTYKQLDYFRQISRVFWDKENCR